MRPSEKTIKGGLDLSVVKKRKKEEQPLQAFLPLFTLNPSPIASMTRSSAVVLFTLVAAALAAPSTGEQAIVVGISSVKSSADVYMAVRDKATSELLATSDSTTLNTGGFSISADVDKDTGAGNLVIGGKTYAIHEDPAVSGGITCKSNSKA